MKTRILMDTGPLVAFLNRKDHYHAWIGEQLAEIIPPLFTCEAILSEACFLLRDIEGGSDAVFELVNRDLVSLSFYLKDEMEAVRKLMARFSSSKTLILHRETEMGEMWTAVIGINHYQQSPKIPALSYAGNDARAFAEYLRENMGFDRKHLFEL